MDKHEQQLHKEQLRREIMQDIIKTYQLMPLGAERHFCIYEVAYGEPPEGVECRNPNPLGPGFPGADHTRIWASPYGEVYITQPYGIDSETLAKMLAFCETHGLRMSISGYSWHCPGHTVLVVVESKQTAARRVQAKADEYRRAASKDVLPAPGLGIGINLAR